MGAEGFGSVERPNSILLEQDEELPAYLAEGRDLRGLDSDRVADQVAGRWPSVRSNCRWWS